MEIASQTTLTVAATIFALDVSLAKRCNTIVDFNCLHSRGDHFRDALIGLVCFHLFLRPGRKVEAMVDEDFARGKRSLCPLQLQWGGAAPRA
jgi:hypothetical protein